MDKDDFLTKEFARQRATTGWLMVAGFVIFSFGFCWLGVR